MTDWSDYFQNPAFLESSRMFVLDADYRESCIRWIGIQENQKILDVGCGTGKFTEYLADGVSGCCFTGLDNDTNLLAYAQQHKREENGNSIAFLEGDALALPFPDNEFDVTVSHTFLTNISSPARALREMRRVTKAGGIVAAVTSQDIASVPCHAGHYPEKYQEQNQNYYQLFQQIQEAYQKVRPISDLVCGADPLEVPYLFAMSGFRNVRMYGLGRAFSLSDARHAPEKKKCYIENQYLSEVEKLKQYELLPEFCQIISEEIRQKYRDALLARKEMLSEMLEHNTAWEWYGGAGLLMVGRVPADISALQRLFPQQK